MKIPFVYRFKESWYVQNINYKATASQSKRHKQKAKWKVSFPKVDQTAIQNKSHEDIHAKTYRSTALERSVTILLGGGGRWEAPPWGGGGVGEVGGSEGS